MLDNKVQNEWKIINIKTLHFKYFTTFGSAYNPKIQTNKSFMLYMRKFLLKKFKIFHNIQDIKSTFYSFFHITFYNILFSCYSSENRIFLCN